MTQHGYRGLLVTYRASYCQGLGFTVCSTFDVWQGLQLPDLLTEPWHLQSTQWQHRQVPQSRAMPPCSPCSEAYRSSTVPALNRRTGRLEQKNRAPDRRTGRLETRRKAQNTPRAWRALQRPPDLTLP